MDQWELLVQEYSKSANGFRKALQTAEAVFKEDLAGFEIEWIVQTLLYEPVCLLKIVCSEQDESWRSCIVASFKLLAEVLPKCEDFGDHLFQDVLNVCLMQYDAMIRTNAINCMRALCKMSPVVAGQAEKFIAELESASICRAPLAMLIGTLCEYHPAYLSNEYNKIWRLFLNLLENNKKTDTVTSAYLQGILGLFKYYGSQLPMVELAQFYQDLVGYLDMTKCKEVVLAILEEHTDLFLESLAEDPTLRMKLWVHVPAGTDAVLRVYRLIFELMKDDLKRIENVLQAEVAPRLHAPDTRYVALRVWSVYTRLGGAAPVQHEDVLQVECSLRAGDHVAAQVSYCIDAALPNSDRLLQAAILNFHSLPAKKIKEIIVYPLARAPDQIRKASINLLTAESCVDDASFDRYLPLWRQLLDSDGQDPRAVEGSRHVFNDFMDYVLWVVETFLDDYNESLPEQLQFLFKLVSLVLSFQSPEGYTRDACAAALPLLRETMRRCQPQACTVAAGRHLLRHAAGLDLDFYEMLSLDSCADEALLCECCLAFIQSPDDLGDVRNILTSLQIIFSRSDVEVDSYLTALKKCQHLLMKDIDLLDSKETSKVIAGIEDLYNRKDLTGKEARNLKREIFFFLGKFGNVSESSASEASSVVLKDNLTLDLKYLDEGVTYKIKLDEMLEHAIRSGDPDILRTLLTVICAGNPARQAERACRVCAAWCRASVASAAADALPVLQALKLSNVTVELLSYIACQRSPGVRGLLSDVLERLLSDPRHQQAVEPVAAQALLMLRDKNALTRQAGLDVSLAVLRAADPTHAPLRAALPALLPGLCGAVGGGAALLAATHAFVRAAAMYDPATTVGMIQEMMRHLTHPKSDVDFACHETTVRTAVDFIKVVASEKKLDSAIFLGIEAASVARKMVLLCELKSAFRFESDFDLRLLEGNGLLDLEVEDLEDPLSVAATLRVLTDFAGTYMEIRREKSLVLLAGLVEKLKPDLIITVNRSIVNCLQTYKDLLGELPPLLTDAFDVWFSVLPINEITTSLEENKLLDEHKAIIKSLNIMLMVFELRSDLIKTWPDSIMKVTPKKSDLEYISSALSASLKASSRDDIKRLISGGDGRDLCRRHVKVFFGFLVKSPSVLLDGDVTSAYSLLDDVVDCYVRKRCPERWRGDVLNLVDGLWPVYEQQTEFSKKQALLVSLSRFPVPPPPTSPPVAWGVKTLMEGEITQRICLVGALPAGEEYSAAYSSFSGVVGPRLREAARGRGPALRALLGAAHCGDPTLLRTVAALAAGDNTKGWWDEAIDSCMAAVAKHRDVTVHETIYAWMWTGLSTGVCERMLVPLLRHTPAKRLEEFLSNKVNMLIDMLMTGRAASNALAYEQGVVNYTRALSVLAVAFEKLPRQSLEASSSVLHSRMASPESWMLVRRACKLCVTLRDAVTCPEGAGGGLRGACRAFYVAAYKCLTAALCRWKQPKAYVTLFDEKALSNLMDPEKRYELPIKPKWSRRSVRRQVPSDTGAAPAAASSGGSVRTRPLLRTLSDNPLHFDLLEPQECEEVTTEEWRVDHTELNGLEACLSVSRALALAAPCAAALRRAAAALCGAAAAQSHVAALLAQAICNSASDLQPNCEILIPALLKYVTAVEDGAALNGLQVDVLNTISGWGGGGARREGADAAVRLLVRTCMQHQRRRPLLDAVADCLDGFLRAHPGTITVRYDAFPDYSADSTSDETKLCMLRILQIITKHNIYVEQLLPTVLAVLADTRRKHPVQKLAELFGQTLAVCDDEAVARESLASYQRVLETYLKTNVADYVRLLYYAQLGCPRCCSFKSFKTVLSKASRLPKAEKLRCLRVIAKYLEHGPGNDDVIRDVVSTLNFEGLLAGDCVKEALEVIRSGLQHYGNTEVLRPAVMLAVKLCDHPAADVRNAAGDVAKKAFEKLCEDHEQSAPKRQRSSLTPVLRVAQGADRYTGSLLRGLGQGLTGDIQGLSTTSFHARFTECFYFAICLPILHSKTPPDVTSAVWNMTRMLFAAAKGQDGLARARLRDEPLDLGAPTAAPSPLTAAPAHLGTFRSAACLTRLHTARSAASAPGLDVQITIAEVLDEVLRFSKTNTKSSIALLVQLCTELSRNRSPGFDFDDAMSGHLAALLGAVGGEMMELVLKLSRVFVDTLRRIEGVSQSVEGLVHRTKGSEGSGLTVLLQEELILRAGREDRFVLGSWEEQDVVVVQQKEFSIDGLKATFGRLANWESMREQDREREASCCPPLWTDFEDLQRRLQEYEIDSDTWFDRMLLLHRGERIRDSVVWQREAARWPRRQFVLSCMAEAIEWKCSEDIGDLYSCVRISGSDCLAEWAGRLMLRCVQGVAGTAGAAELRWAGGAARAALWGHVSACVERARGHTLNDADVPKFLLLNLKMKREMATGASGKLDELLTKAERHAPVVLEHASDEEFYGINEMLLRIRSDLGTMNQASMDAVLQTVGRRLQRGGAVSPDSRRALDSMYEMYFVYYNHLWTESDDERRKKIFLWMLDMMVQAARAHTVRLGALVAAACDRLPDSVPDNVLEKLELAFPALQDWHRTELVSRLRRPASTLRSYKHLSSQLEFEGRAETFKRRLRLVCDPEYTLVMYCGDLLEAATRADPSQWKMIFDRVKSDMYDGGGGPEYLLLENYKSALFDIEDYENSDTETKIRTLRRVQEGAGRGGYRPTLRLSQLCGGLGAEPAAGDCVSAVLQLPPGVTVVEFYEEVAVMPSIRRPCMVRALLSSGVTRRWLVKRDQLLHDRAASRLLPAAAIPGSPPSLYNVTLLSEDCGLIEYLEGHHSIRSLAAKSCDLDNLGVSRPLDADLLAEPPSRLALTHERFCGKVPATALRSAFQELCCTSEDFIRRKKRFQDSLATITIFNWIFDVGDRHMENFLVEAGTGALCCIDWGSTMQRRQLSEPPPARLTRNMLAMCDPIALEGRLQTALTQLRDSRETFLATARLLYARSPACQPQLSHLKAILEGRVTSADIRVEANPDPDLDRLQALLLQVFPGRPAVDTYSVKDQVKVLLRHCTDPRVLGATRAGWEPWL